MTHSPNAGTSRMSLKITVILPTHAKRLENTNIRSPVA